MRSNAAKEGADGSKSSKILGTAAARKRASHARVTATSPPTIDHRPPPLTTTRPPSTTTTIHSGESRTAPATARPLQNPRHPDALSGEPLRELLLEHDHRAAEHRPVRQQLEQQRRRDLERGGRVGRRQKTFTSRQSEGRGRGARDDTVFLSSTYYNHHSARVTGNTEFPGSCVSRSHQPVANKLRRRESALNPLRYVFRLTLYGTLATRTSKNGRGTFNTSPWIIWSVFSHSLRRRRRRWRRGRRDSALT